MYVLCYQKARSALVRTKGRSFQWSKITKKVKAASYDWDWMVEFSSRLVELRVNCAPRTLIELTDSSVRFGRESVLRRITSVIVLNFMLVTRYCLSGSNRSMRSCFLIDITVHCRQFINHYSCNTLIFFWGTSGYLLHLTREWWKNPSFPLS